MLCLFESRHICVSYIKKPCNSAHVLQYNLYQIMTGSASWSFSEIWIYWLRHVNCCIVWWHKGIWQLCYNNCNNTVIEQKTFKKWHEWKCLKRHNVCRRCSRCSETYQHMYSITLPVIVRGRLNSKIASMFWCYICRFWNPTENLIKNKTLFWLVWVVSDYNGL